MTRQSFSLILASLVGVLVTAYVVECGSALNQPTLLSGPILWLCSWFSDVQLAGRFLMCLTCIAAASLGFGVFVLTSRLRLSLRTGALSALSIIALSYLRPISTLSLVVSAELQRPGSWMAAYADTALPILVLGLVSMRYRDTDTMAPRR